MVMIGTDLLLSGCRSVCRKGTAIFARASRPDIIDDELPEPFRRRGQVPSFHPGDAGRPATAGITHGEQREAAVDSLHLRKDGDAEPGRDQSGDGVRLFSLEADIRTESRFLEQLVGNFPKTVALFERDDRLETGG